MKYVQFKPEFLAANQDTPERAHASCIWACTPYELPGKTLYDVCLRPVCTHYHHVDGVLPGVWGADLPTLEVICAVV